MPVVTLRSSSDDLMLKTKEIRCLKQVIPKYEYVPFQEHIYLYRTFLLFGFGLVATFGSSKLEFPGAGPLGCLTMAFVAALRWRKEERTAQEGVELYDCFVVSPC